MLITRHPVKGIINDCLEDVEMFCRDTRFVKHEDVKRPLNRTEVEDNISRMRKSIVGAMNYRKEQDTTYLEKIKNFKIDIIIQPTTFLANIKTMRHILVSLKIILMK